MKLKNNKVTTGRIFIYLFVMCLMVLSVVQTASVKLEEDWWIIIEKKITHQVSN